MCVPSFLYSFSLTRFTYPCNDISLILILPRSSSSHFGIVTWHLKHVSMKEDMLQRENFVRNLKFRPLSKCLKDFRTSKWPPSASPAIQSLSKCSLSSIWRRSLREHSKFFSKKFSKGSESSCIRIDPNRSESKSPSKAPNFWAKRARKSERRRLVKTLFI